MKCADRSLIAFVLGMFACLPWAHAQTPQPPERVKAAFLYNFGLYVEWPKGAAQADQIAIGVLGAEQVAEELRSVVTGRKIQDRPVRVQPLSSLEELDGVHILYVG